MGQDTSFPVEFEFDAEGTRKMRCDIEVRMRQPWDEAHDMATDEAPAYGGDGSAPTPLHTFTTALAGCLMTQLRVMSRRVKVPIHGVRISGRTEWIARSEDRAPHLAEPVAFELDIALETDADEAEQRRLVDAAQRSCFVEQSLKPGILKHRLWLGDGWVDL